MNKIHAQRHLSNKTLIVPITSFYLALIRIQLLIEMQTYERLKNSMDTHFPKVIWTEKRYQNGWHFAMIWY